MTREQNNKHCLFGSWADNKWRSPSGRQTEQRLVGLLWNPEGRHEDLKEMFWEGVEWIDLAQDRVQLLWTQYWLKMPVFWDVAQCILVDTTFQRSLRPPSSGWCGDSSETSVNIYQNTLSYIPYSSPWEPEISRYWTTGLILGAEILDWLSDCQLLKKLSRSWSIVFGSCGLYSLKYVRARTQPWTRKVAQCERAVCASPIQPLEPSERGTPGQPLSVSWQTCRSSGKVHDVVCWFQPKFKKRDSFYS
jgi:hypothetical protein